MVSEIQLMSNEKRIYLISTISNYIISSMRQRARERIAQFLFRVDRESTRMSEDRCESKQK